MSKIKTSSTYQENKSTLHDYCPVTITLGIIGGRWKPIILFHLQKGKLRYGELRKCIPGITEKMLVQQLRELETDQLIIRDVKPVVPPHVEYKLSPKGRSLDTVLNEMGKWGLLQKKKAR